jgi:phage portal protein BeeE
MVGVGGMPNYNNIEALNQQYYSQCLQVLIEALELCLKEGLEIADPLYVESDLDGLLRMDAATKMDSTTKAVKGGVYTPNEGRQKHNKPPLPGGDTVFLQEQDHSLEWLSRRDAMPIQPKLPPAVPPPVMPTKDFDEEASILEFEAKAVALGLLQKAA